MDQVGPPTRRGDGENRAVGLCGDPGADLGEPAHRRTVGIGHPGDPVGQVDGHQHGRRREVIPRRVTAPVREPRLHRATGDIGEQCAAAVDRRHRDGRVDRAFVAAAGLADQAQPADGARYRGGVPHRGFQQHVGGGVVDLGGSRAHHSTDGRDGDVVGDQHIARVEAPVHPVEGDDGLPRSGEPDREVAADLAAVVGVHGMAEFEHDVVGDVDGR